jgi:transposase-like protein
MDPQQVFCPNPDCPARGQRGQGNIHVHSRSERRYRCQVCGRTFAARKGTVFYRLRTPEVIVTQVVTLLAYGCPLPAIVMALGLDERTVADWQVRAGAHCQQVQAQLVEQPRDLGQVQADELWVKLQGLKVWMAMALQVGTRLWLGGGDFAPPRSCADWAAAPDRASRGPPAAAAVLCGWALDVYRPDPAGISHATATLWSRWTPAAEALARVVHRAGP